MRAVIVVVLPDLPDEVNGELTAMIQAAGRALDVPGLEGSRAIVTIRDAADAVLRAAEPNFFPERVVKP